MSHFAEQKHFFIVSYSRFFFDLFLMFFCFLVFFFVLFFVLLFDFSIFLILFYCFFFVFSRFFAFGQVKGNARDGRSRHRPTKVFEFVK